jgi:N-acetylmuramoyl-L-alanine amidase
MSEKIGVITIGGRVVGSVYVTRDTLSPPNIRMALASYESSPGEFGHPGHGDMPRAPHHHGDRGLEHHLPHGGGAEHDHKLRLGHKKGFFPKTNNESEAPAPSPTGSVDGLKGLGGWWTADRVNQGVQRLMKGGMPEVSARAMIATAAGVEANNGPGETNSSGHSGIFQWSTERQRAGGGLPKDYEGQIDFALKELSGPEKRAGDALRAARTPEQAAQAMLQFERGGYGTGKILRTMERMGRGDSNAPAPSGAPAAAPDPAGQPGRVPGVEPEAFIMHHTTGRPTVQGVKDTLNERGLGVEYIMDRDGHIVRFSGAGAANIMNEDRYRATPILGEGRPFLNNRNIVGMEVSAKNDADVTPAQVAAAKAFIARNYPNTPIFGHGEVNPGHKEADEGKTITDAINADRAARAAEAKKPKTATAARPFDPSTDVP